MKRRRPIPTGPASSKAASWIKAHREPTSLAVDQRIGHSAMPVYHYEPFICGRRELGPQFKAIREAR